MSRDTLSPLVPLARSPLARLEEARRLLAEARTLDEVKAVRDVAERARLYARQAQLGLEAQNDAAELALRAERQAGALLAAVERRPGTRTDLPTSVQAGPRLAAYQATLQDVRVTPSTAKRWQALARVPAAVFEAHIAEVRAQGRRDGRTELTTAGALRLARPYQPPYVPPPVPVPLHDRLDPRDRFEVADAAALPWPDGSVDLIVTSPPYGLQQDYGAGGEVSDYGAWLAALESWLRELLRVARPAWGRLCLNVPLDRDLGGWEPVSADVVQCARTVGWQFRTWILWDKDQAGAGTDRGSLDSASAPNVTAPVESVLVFYRGAWRRDGPAAMPHDRWQAWCGPRGLWHFPGTDDPAHPAPFPEDLPERCITLFSFPEDVVADPFVGTGTTAAVAARLGRIAWAADRDPACIVRTRAWVARVRS